MKIDISDIVYVSDKGVGLDKLNAEFENNQLEKSFDYTDLAEQYGPKGWRYIPDSTKLFCNVGYQLIHQNQLEEAISSKSFSMGVFNASELDNLTEVWEVSKAVVANGPNAYSPLRAPNMLPNSSASYFAIRWKINGPNFTICAGTNSLMRALEVADMYIKEGIIDKALVISFHVEDEISKEVRTRNYELPAPPSFGFGILLDKAENKVGTISKIFAGKLFAQSIHQKIESGLENKEEIDVCLIGGTTMEEIAELKAVIAETFDKKSVPVFVPEEEFGFAASSFHGLSMSYFLWLKKSRPELKKALLINYSLDKQIDLSLLGI